MTQTAEVIKFERPFVKADIENGFDRIAGGLTDALANPPVKLSPREYQVIHAVISKTYRFHKKSDWIASCQLSEITGIDESNISRVKKSLIEKNVLFQEGRNIAINPVISEWQERAGNSQKQRENRQKRREQKPSETTSHSSELTREPSETTNQTVRNDDNNRKTIKQQITKQKTKRSSGAKLEINLPEFIPKDLLEDFIKNRAKLKKPMTDKAIELFVAKLTALHNQGYSVTELVNEAIMNGWQSVYPPKGNHRKSQGPQPDNFSQKDYGEAEGSFLS